MALSFKIVRRILHTARRFFVSKPALSANTRAALEGVLTGSRIALADSLGTQKIA